MKIYKNSIILTLIISIISIAYTFSFVTLALGNSSSGIKADEILVIKHKNLLLILKDGKVLKSYNVALGKKAGPKTSRGDKKTPEGLYIIDRHDISNNFYKSLHISYPNASDIIRAKKTGQPTGNDIAIHGLPKGFEDLGTFQSKRNWTKGCIALSNEEIDEIWDLVEDGTQIEIIP